MKIHRLECSDQLTFLALEGSFNLAGAQEAGPHILAEISSRNAPAILDLSQVDFIASMGMRVLVDATKTLNRAQAPLILLRPQPAVEKVLDAAGLTNILTICHDEAEARRVAQR